VCCISVKKNQARAGRATIREIAFKTNRLLKSLLGVILNLFQDLYLDSTGAETSSA
jgi:hypothetical protein